MRSATNTTVACLAALLLALPATARATGPSPSPETTVMTDKARQLYEEGLAAIQKSKWLEARASLVAAWSLNKHWQIAANLAGCELELGKFRDAAEHAAFYLQNAPLDRRARAEAVLARAKQKIGTLTVNASPDAAEVRVDGDVVGQVPLDGPLYLEPGVHVVLVRAPGRADAMQNVPLAAGESRAITVSAPDAPPPPPTPSRTGPSTALLVAGGVTTGVALVVGTALEVASKSKASTASTDFATVVMQRGPAACAQQTAPGCQALNDTIVSKSTLGSAAAWTFIGAGVVGAATLVYGLAAPRGPARSGVLVAPVITAREGGLLLRGVW
jgi:hypothetical protein